MSEKYVVWCRVSGGVRGTWTAMLKENGKIREWDDVLEAANHARYLTEQMNTGRSKATFRYWAGKRGDVWHMLKS